MKRALITGVTGQDGSYMAELLLSKGYHVSGMVRRLSVANHENIEGLDIELLGGDLLDSVSLENAVIDARPDEIYNFAAQSFVPASFEQPLLTAETTGLGAIRLFEAARRFAPHARIYQASSSEMFGGIRSGALCEETPFHPRSPYAYSKVMAHHAAINFREAYKMHISCGICFNHESPRRGQDFVTRKITKAVAEISRGERSKLALGNLEAERDWGYAGDYVKAIWMMLQSDEPAEYVIGTGKAHSVREWCELAFDLVGLKMADHVYFDPALKRPSEVATLTADTKKACCELGWEPQTGFDDLVRLMLEADGARLRRAA